MKKLITIALLCAMLLSCFASCGAMQAAELDVDAYAADAVAQNVDFRTELSDDADVWDGSTDRSWYDNDPTKKEYEISTGAQLRGLYDIMQKLANKTSCLEGVTIKLTNDIDLDGRVWSSPASERYFAGTFDGQGHVIANYYNQATGSGYQSFFGSVTGNACIKNITLIDGIHYNKLNPSDKKARDVIGTLVSRATTVEGQTITISNVYTCVDFQVTSSAKYALNKVGGIVGQVQGDGDLLIENCENASTVNCNGNSVAGIIVYLSAAKNVTIKNCAVSGSLTAKGSGNGGIIGTINKMTGALTIEGCTVTAPISGTGTTAGIIGSSKTTKEATIKDCVVTGNITGTTQVAGIWGYIGNGDTAGDTVIDNCTVSGALVGTTMSGGIVGYTGGKKVSKLTISNCEVTGSFTGKRTSGGLIGTLNIGSGKAHFENCEVTAALTFTLDDVKNNNAGGLIGKLQTAGVTIDNCHVDSIMKATFAPGTPALNDDGSYKDDIHSGAAGLIGRVFDGDSVQISNCSVAGSYEFIHDGNAHGLFFNVGRFVGSVGEGATVTYRENNTVASDLEIVCTGAEADFALDAKDCVPSILPIGYQTKVNDNGTYDLRYIIAAKDMFDGVGVRANIRFVNADGVFDEKNNNFYVSTVYDYVVDEDFNIYEAAQYSYDYLYTLVVTGVPAEYSFDAGNLQVILKPFGATMNDGVLNVQEIGLLTQGENLANTSAANMGITADNFSNVIDDKFLADGAIYIDGHSFDPSVSYAVHTGVKASAAECDGGYADGTLTPPAHIYLDGDLAVGNAKQLMNATYNFKVAEAGWYDISVYMRLKGSGDTGDGAYDRAYLMMFDWAGGEQAYNLDIELDSCAELKDASAGTYLNGLKVYLEAGEHTVTFKTDIGMSNGYPHIRGIYLAKAD